MLFNNLFAPETGAGAGAIIALVIVVLGFNHVGYLADASSVTAIASLAILIFGMPHGSFDLALLQRGSLSKVTLVTLYLICAGAMYFLWRAAPVLALAAFLLMAIVHFAEDWAASGSRFIALGTALAFVSAPALLHTDRLRSLFAMLTADPAAAILVDALLLLAPVSIAIALIGFGSLWQAEQKSLAVSGLGALVAMLVLPPVQGFAIFFCLVHSALQFRHHAQSLGLHSFRRWRGIVVPVSLGGLGVAGAVLAFMPPAPLETGLFITSFTALSVLTAPHMLVPLMLRAVRQKALFAAV